MMISQLSEELYNKSIQLKKYNSKNLLFKKNRLSLEKQIYELKDITEKIVFALRNDFNYSNNYFELALFMSNTLSECIVFLNSKGKGSREAVQRYVWGFHNLPRAFFSLNNCMRISPEKAVEYDKPYLKKD